MNGKQSNGFASFNGMDSSERTRLLAVIDKFRELGISEDISLPQLVVVGDQSSGKSSLLEGLTGVAFPVASELCTRFATQIVLRRVPAEKASIRISIIPGSDSSVDKDLKQRLLGFSRTIDDDKFGSTEFAEVLNGAAECMGLPKPDAENVEDLEKRFSDDVLKIDISGPAHHHLSVVDVPGLFHNPTKYQTKEDAVIIRNLIGDYINDRRTIILAVLDARNNLANQEVFKMARTADPSGLRTVGIITKCDAVQVGDEVGVMKIAQNQIERLNYGWFAVRNRSTKEIQEGVTIEARHANEKKFFNTTPWNQLGKDHVGIDSLKRFLGRLLYNHIREEFPGLIRELQHLADEAQRERDELGPPRQTCMQQRQFLTRLSGHYQRAVRNALVGNYASDLGPQHPLKLRMLLQNLNENFAKRMALHGHTIPFNAIDGTVDDEYGQDLQETEAQDINTWIRTIYRESRGAELPGTVNPAVLENMFRQQTVNWETIAVEHLSEVEHTINRFNDALMSETIRDVDIRTGIAFCLDQQHKKSFKAARIQLQTILDDERTGILQTVNHYFADNLAAVRKQRVISRLGEAGLVDGMDQLIDLLEITAAAHLGNEDQAVNDIHDILKSFYKVAIKRFIDNVVVQVVERYYLGLAGPVKLLSPEFIGAMSDSELQNIAAEDFTASTTRTNLDTKIDRLQKVLNIALHRQEDYPAE